MLEHLLTLLFYGLCLIWFVRYLRRLRPSEKADQRALARELERIRVRTSVDKRSTVRSHEQAPPALQSSAKQPYTVTPDQRRCRSVAGVIAHTVLFGLLWSPVGYLVTILFSRVCGLGSRTGWQYLIGMGLSFLVVSVVQVVSQVRTIMLRRSFETRRCQHGVEGGETMRKCAACFEAERQRQVEDEKKRESEQRKWKIKNDAATLARNEEMRIAQALLRRKEYLLAMPPRDFEDVVVEMYSRLGYKAQGTPYSNDQGRDAIISKNGKTFFVECKRYKSDSRIGREPLMKLFAAVKAENVSGGTFVTTAGFTDTAAAFAAKVGIELVDGDQLTRLMSKAFPVAEADRIRIMCTECGDTIEIPFPATMRSTSCRIGHTVPVKASLQDISAHMLTDRRFCKRCGAEMRIRVHHNRAFWGCSEYPNCSYSERCS